MGELHLDVYVERLKREVCILATTTTVLRDFVTHGCIKVHSLHYDAMCSIFLGHSSSRQVACYAQLSAALHYTHQLWSVYHCTPLCVAYTAATVITVKALSNVLH
jgi:hypothetical protein